MRLVIDTLIALMLACILGGVLIHHRQEQWRALAMQEVRDALARLHEQAVFHGALDRAASDLDGSTRYPTIIYPEWFGADLPLNYLAPGKLAWIDLAPPGDWSDHPPDPVVTGSTIAGFWYNPNRGIFRARVLPQVSEEQTLRLYNQVNASFVKSLPRGFDESRRPAPLPILSTTAVAAAPTSAPPAVDLDLTHDRAAPASVTRPTLQDRASPR